MKTRQVRWKHNVLTPQTLALVPTGYSIASRENADLYAATRFAILPKDRAQAFAELWKRILDAGLQPSGLLVTCLTAVPPPAGHMSDIAARRLGAFCANQGLWVRVPGKITPFPCEGVRGRRQRAYLVVIPTEEIQ